jgi:hypothetical protein
LYWYVELRSVLNLSTSAPRGCHVSSMRMPHHCHVDATLSPRCYHIICHVAATSSATWLPHQLPTHLYKWRGKLIHDDHFRHIFGLRAGFNGFYTNLWRFENVMDHANLWRKLKDVTRRDPWRSIHDVLKFRHRCRFMTKFWWSVTKIDRHRPQDFL